MLDLRAVDLFGRFLSPTILKSKPKITVIHNHPFVGTRPIPASSKPIAAAWLACPPKKDPSLQKAWLLLTPPAKSFKKLKSKDPTE